MIDETDLNLKLEEVGTVRVMTGWRRWGAVGDMETGRRERVRTLTRRSTSILKTSKYVIHRMNDRVTR